LGVGEKREIGERQVCGQREGRKGEKKISRRRAKWGRPVNSLLDRCGTIEKKSDERDVWGTDGRKGGEVSLTAEQKAYPWFGNWGENTKKKGGRPESGG